MHECCRQRFIFFVSVGLCMISISWLCKRDDICPPKFIFSNVPLWVERGDQHHANKGWEHQRKVRHGNTNKTQCCFCCVKLTRVLSGTLLGNADRACIILCYYFMLYLQPWIQPRKLFYVTSISKFRDSGKSGM